MHSDISEQIWLKLDTHFETNMHDLDIDSNTFNSYLLVDCFCSNFGPVGIAQVDGYGCIIVDSA